MAYEEADSCATGVCMYNRERKGNVCERSVFVLGSAVVIIQRRRLLWLLVELKELGHAGYNGRGFVYENGEWNWYCALVSEWKRNIRVKFEFDMYIVSQWFVQVKGTCRPAVFIITKKSFRKKFNLF